MKLFVRFILAQPQQLEFPPPGVTSILVTRSLLPPARVANWGEDRWLLKLWRQKCRLLCPVTFFFGAFADKKTIFFFISWAKINWSFPLIYRGGARSARSRSHSGQTSEAFHPRREARAPGERQNQQRCLHHRFVQLHTRGRIPRGATGSENADRQSRPAVSLRVREFCNRGRVGQRVRFARAGAEYSRHHSPLSRRDQHPSSIHDVLGRTVRKRKVTYYTESNEIPGLVKIATGFVSTPRWFESAQQHDYCWSSRHFPFRGLAPATPSPPTLPHRPFIIRQLRPGPFTPKPQKVPSPTSVAVRIASIIIFNLGKLW